MCKSPIVIPNPNYGADPKKNPLKNCTDATIAVNCGYCDECVAVKQMYLVQRVQMESMKNHLFMCTLTYNNETLPVKNVNGFRIKYADIRDVQCMIKRLKKYNSFGIPFRHFGVLELGTKRGRPHVHLLFLFDKKYFDKTNYVADCTSFATQHYFTPLNQWKRNYGSNKYPEYRDLCTYIRKLIRGRWKSNYDFHYIQPALTSNGVLDAAFYVLKYMLKPSDRAVRLQRALRLNVDPESYDKLWNEIKPRYFKSLGFGLNSSCNVNTHEYIPDEDLVNVVKDNIRFSLAAKSKYPLFFKDDGCTFPLAPYYKKHKTKVNDLPENGIDYSYLPTAFTKEDALAFHKFSLTDDSSELRNHKNYTQLQTELMRYEKIKQICDDGDDADFDFMFE